MILLSFCSSSDAFYNECNIPGKYHTIIDLYNRADGSRIHTILKNRKDFPEIAKWMIAARSNYLQFLAALSQTELNSNVSIRDFKLFDFSIYWITAIAEKQPRTHWLFSFFLFQEFLNSNYYKDEQLVIYLNHQTKDLKEHIIELNAESKKQRKIHFYIPKKYSTFEDFKEVIKRQLVSFFYKIKNKTQNTSPDNNQIQIITLNTDRVFYKQFLTSAIFENYNVSFKPLNIYISKEDDYKHITSDFFDYQPQKWEKIQIFLRSILLFIRIYFIKDKFMLNHKTYPSAILKNELYDVLKNAQIFIGIYLWYKKYFEKVKISSIYFLDDEFYKHGRIISKACKDAGNEKIKLFGMQHGMFSESHTVYAVLQEELKDIKSGDSIPIPQKFIVWGNYFKEIFEKNNKLRADYTLVLGCPHYSQLKQKNKELKISGKNANYILWCTTGAEQFVYELPFVLKLMELYALPLVIRNHPAGHVSKDLVEKTMKGIGYTNDAEKEIYKSILNSEFVVTSAHSTVVLDCLVCNKKVYRIIFDRSDEEFSGEFEMIINVNKVNELEKINLIPNSSFENSNKYLYLNEDHWKAFLKSNLTE